MMASRKNPLSKELVFLHTDYDSRIECRYILMTITINSLLDIFEEAYNSQGAIEGQRDVVRTATATRIRRRMAIDLQEGAILPPIVLGAVAGKAAIAKKTWKSEDLANLLANVHSSLSIIDGMQRTAVMMEGRKRLGTRAIRIELWLASSTEKLVYRMLVLNTGQIPWNLRRQLEVVHRSLLDEIRKSLGDEIEIYKADDKSRRTDACEFQGNDVIEMYLAFNLRKPHVDKETVLADQFSKLDLIEAVSRPRGLADFISAMKVMLSLDRMFYIAKEKVVAKGVKQSGRHIFDKVSACAGFMAAYAQFVFGKVGLNRDKSQQKVQSAKIKKSTEGLIVNHEDSSSDDMHAFLCLDTLEEVSAKRTGALSIGEQERELFLTAFKLLFEEGANLQSMEPCWRSQLGGSLV